MRVQDITAAVLSVASLLSVAQAAALPAADAATADAADVVSDDDATAIHALETRVIGNEVNSLLCITPGTTKCGIYVTYTNGKRRESVQYQTGGLTACSFELIRKHTSGDGFWGNIDFFPSPGLHVGYNPTGKQMSLGKATFSIQDQTYLNSRCQSIFGWGNVDTSKSTQSFWGDLPTELY